MKMSGEIRRRDKMKKGLSVIIGIGLILTSYGCILERRGDDYGRQHEYRDHGDHRDGGYERDRDGHRDSDEGGDRDEHRDYEDQRY
jgi:hypothetical protein